MPATTARLRSIRPAPHVGVILLMVLTCIVLVGLDLRQCWAGRETALNNAKIETANLARSIAAHAHDTFTIVDSVLLNLREHVTHDGTRRAAIARLEQVMRMNVSGQSLIRGLFLIDEHGALLANSIPGSPHDANYAERDYFRYHRDVADDHVLIGHPVSSKVDGSSVVTVTHRISHDDGNFAGVLSATIATKLFQSEFRSFDVGAHGIITMVNGRHEILVRHPFSEENVGRTVNNSSLFLQVEDGAEARSFEFVGMIDGLTRIGSYNRVPGFDLIILVSRDKNEVLAGWLRETKVHLAWMAFALSALAILVWRKVMWMRANTRTEALYRLLADNSSDAIICLGRDRRRLYVSPSFTAMTGWTESELLDDPPREIVAPEDRPIAATAFADLLAGREQVAVSFRYLCKDGATVWVELRARPTADPLGRLLIFVANVRDISRQKAIEEQLAATHADLVAISLTDPLTGIANRRRFNEAVLKEWQRAMRDGLDLAVLMVDADHFKTYNDLYGHPQGDVCLRLIAVTLNDCICRPGDLVARYGGEEFALILPGTSGDAAALMANLMRQAVASQAIEHRGNESGLVTISIGAAAVVPQQGSEPETLIKMADEALYEAKRTGRNRVVLGAHATVGHRIHLPS